MANKITDIVTARGKSKFIKQVNINPTKDCYHGEMLVDAATRTVTCGKCNVNLDPMWVLIELSSGGERMRQIEERVQEKVNKSMRKLNCQCEHCGKHTRIMRES